MKNKKIENNLNQNNKEPRTNNIEQSSLLRWNKEKTGDLWNASSNIPSGLFFSKIL